MSQAVYRNDKLITDIKWHNTTAINRFARKKQVSLSRWKSPRWNLLITLDRITYLALARAPSKHNNNNKIIWYGDRVFGYRVLWLCHCVMSHVWLCHHIARLCHHIARLCHRIARLCHRVSRLCHCVARLSLCRTLQNVIQTPPDIHRL